MTLAEFRATISDAQPPHVQRLLVALWHAARGEWDAAHNIAQDIDTKEAAWVHAHLHRVEGDLSNARYWYRQADQPPATDSLDVEWTRIVSVLLK